MQPFLKNKDVQFFYINNSSRLDAQSTNDEFTFASLPPETFHPPKVKYIGNYYSEKWEKGPILYFIWRKNVNKKN